VSIVLLVPGTGDDLQAMKAGVMEIGDLFVVNKADREGADRVVQAISASLALKPADPGEWTPPILKTEATTGAGVEALWSEIGRFRQWAVEHRHGRREERRRSRVRSALTRAFLRHVDRVLPPGEIDRLGGSDAAGQPDPYSAADAILSRVLALGRSGATDA
jgi:LAO/AO transport system kinase